MSSVLSATGLATFQCPAVELEQESGEQEAAREPHPNQDLIDGLRAMADWIERSEWPDKPHTSFNVFPGKDGFAEAVKRLGTCEKNFGETWFNAIKRFGPLRIEICLQREQVCNRVKVGTKVIPARPEMLLAAEPERVEDVYEWECPK